MSGLIDLIEVEAVLKAGLVYGDPQPPLRPTENGGSLLAHAVAKFDWSQVLTSNVYQDFWTAIKGTKCFKDINEQLQTYLTSHGSEDHLNLFALAVSCLQLFVQANWTGFVLTKEATEDAGCFFSHFKNLDPESWQSILDDGLVLDGESVSPVAKYLDLLLLSRLIFVEGKCNIYNKNWMFQWWRLRNFSIHQQVLSEKSETLYRQATETVSTVCSHEEWLEISKESSSSSTSLFLHLNLEIGHFYAAFFEVTKLQTCIESCLDRAGLRVTETGALGKRTKFQVSDLAQFALDIASTDCKEEKEADIRHDSQADHQVDVKLEDEIRLEKIKFSEKRDPSPFLSLTKQAIVLAMFVLKQRSQPRDALTNEELLPYLDVILSSDSCWSFRTSALLFRSKLESNNRRTVERSMMQIQSLVDSINQSEVSIDQRKNRLAYIYASKLPPSWSVEKDLCRSLQSLGSTKAALDLALRLQLWEDVIHLYHELQLRHKAADVIRQELAKKETALLYCMLGDATDEIDHYHKALEISGNRSARAFRSLGVYFYFKKDYAQAVEFFQKSVELNSFQLNTLLRLAYSATQLNDWELTAKTYRKYCTYDSDNFEAWNNLSNAYIKLGQKARAWKVLQEAVKCDYDNWKIWDNIMVVSTDCAHFEEIIRAYHRILDLKEKHFDGQILEILVRAILTDVKDNYGRSASILHPTAMKLFGRLTSQITTESKLWELYSELASFKSSGEQTLDDFKVCQYLQKALSCLSQKSGWEKNVENCEEALRIAQKYAQAALDTSSKSNNGAQNRQLLASAKMSVKGIIARVKQNQTSVQTGEIVELLKPHVEKATQCVMDLELESHLKTLQ